MLLSVNRREWEKTDYSCKGRGTMCKWGRTQKYSLASFPCVCHKQKYTYLKNKTITMWVPLWLYCVMLCFLPSGNVTGADDVWQHRNNQQASLRTNKQCLSHRRVGLKAHYVGFAWEPSVCVLNTSHNLKPVPSVMARINNREHRFSVDCFYHFKVDQSKSKYCHSHWKQARNNSSDFLDLKEVCCSAVSTFFLPQGSALWLLFCLSWEARHFHWCSYCWCHPSKSKHLPKYVLIQSIIFPAAMLFTFK